MSELSKLKEAIDEIAKVISEQASWDYRKPTDEDIEVIRKASNEEDNFKLVGIDNISEKDDGITIDVIFDVYDVDKKEWNTRVAVAEVEINKDTIAVI